MDSNGFEYKTEYNGDGLISAFVNPDGSKTQINYYDEGHIRSIVNPDGSEVTFTYDANDRVVCSNIDPLLFVLVCISKRGGGALELNVPLLLNYLYRLQKTL